MRWNIELMTDKIIKALAHNGKIAITCINSSNLVEEARKIHDLSPVTTAAFGRLLTMASIIGVEMKEKEDKLTIRVKRKWWYRRNLSYIKQYTWS